MTKTVVLPLDGSDVSLRALPVAERLAATFAAELVLLTTPTTTDTEGVAPVWLEDVRASVGSERTRAVVSRSLFAVDGIVDTVRGLDDVLLCMATHGRGRLGTTILGSVARDVVKSVGVPVVLVGPHCPTEGPAATGPLVVGHDGSPASDAVVPAACDWARAAALDVVVVSVHHPLDVESARAPAPRAEEAVQHFRDAGVGVELRAVASSYPVGAILDVVEEVGATALAVSTHGRSGLGWVVLGSVAGSLVHAAPCPVLVVRPAELA